MLFNMRSPSRRLLNALCYNCRSLTLSSCQFNLDNKYTDAEKHKILQVINNSDIDTLLSYDISKVKLKKLSQYQSNNGHIQTISDLEYIEGFSEKYLKKLFSNIINETQKEKSLSNKIKGQILHPNLCKKILEDLQTVLSVYVTVNSVCWTLMDKEKYEVREWKYFGIDYPDGKRLQITDILEISGDGSLEQFYTGPLTWIQKAWRILQQLPMADIYVMKAEATTLRAAGSDPNNPKVLAVNLQKAQMVSMLVALINARSSQQYADNKKQEDTLTQSVYFLRPTLPFRLYGTLVGTERVSTEQTVEILLRDLSERNSKNANAYVPEHLQEMFRSQKDLQKDMLGHCLLLSLTFMDLCIYKNQDRIAKLINRRQQ